jgi:hypothetical protein
LRPLTAILVGLALVLAFVQAPFLHTHQHQATQRHPAPFIHLHLKSTHPAGSGPEMRGLDPDDDAQIQNWFSQAPTISGWTPGILPASFRPSTPEGGRWMLEAPLEMGHDPPLLGNKGSRAPPA